MTGTTAHVILLLDLAIENPIDEAMVRAQLPPDGSTREVLRVTNFGAVPCDRGTPIDWGALIAAVDRMVKQARWLASGDACRYWVAGRAGLPAFFHLGYRLTKKAHVTLVNPRDSAAPDILQIDVETPGEPMAAYFQCSPWPEHETQDRRRIGLLVSSKIHLSRDHAASAMHGIGATVEAQADGPLDEQSRTAAVVELDRVIAGLRRWYPRGRSLAVLVAGPATLAFLTGRAINPNIYDDIQVFQHREGRYSIAYATDPIVTHTILLLSANPRSSNQLLLDYEVKGVQRALARATYRDQLVFEWRPAAEEHDLMTELRELEPSIVHFSGHGEVAGIVVSGADRAERVVSPEAVAETLRVAGRGVQLVVLNCCYSEQLAELLIQHVDCVVGMRGEILDASAIMFAESFYGGLAEGHSVREAFHQGRASIATVATPRAGPGRDLVGQSRRGPDPEAERPQLRVREGVNADSIRFAKAAR